MKSLKIFRIFLPVLFWGLLASSCSIKEDRTDCPCLLRLDFSQIPAQEREGVLLLGVREGESGDGSGKEGFSLDEVVNLGAVGDVYELRVPRGGVWVNLWTETASDCIGEGGLVIPFGEDCPPVKMHSAFVETDCETVTETVSLKKNYCRLTVNFSEERTSFPFDIAVRGNVDGYGMNGEPHAGEFSHYMRATLKSATDVSCSLCLPRQKDSALSLEIAEEASVLKSFALGNYIEGSGYDWSASELDDIVVTIDYARTRLSITVGEWERSYDFDVVF